MLIRRNVVKIDERTKQVLAYVVALISVSATFIGGIALLKFFHDTNTALFYTALIMLIVIFVVLLFKEVRE